MSEAAIVGGLLGGQPFIQLVTGKDRSTLAAIIDTGFDGELLLTSRETAEALNISFKEESVTRVAMADGSHMNCFFAVHAIEWLGERRKVGVHIPVAGSLSTQASLLGTELLRGCRLVIDFEAETVLIERSVAHSTASATTD